MRVGVFWFFLALAAVTSGRMWTGLLWAVVAGMAGYQIVAAWQENSDSGRSGSGHKDGPEGGFQHRVIAMVCAGAIPLLAAYSTGSAGLGLIVVPLLVVFTHVFSGQRPADATATLIGAIVPAISAASVVFAVRIDLWAGLFLVVAVSLYDAGSFLLGADAGSRWEGPVAGIIGALAVTFTMAAFHPSPFDGASAWIAGGVVALTCPLGQMLAGVFLPEPTTRARGLRRLDAYLVAGPAFLACAAAASL
ncbi:MAG TPA: hypothetical protein VL068_13970 [Microthrixaceae bacterium]|nr:hypothetical protein [Microthrixaceae bacterium]